MNPPDIPPTDLPVAPVVPVAPVAPVAPVVPPKKTRAKKQVTESSAKPRKPRAKKAPPTAMETIGDGELPPVPDPPKRKTRAKKKPSGETEPEPATEPVAEPVPDPVPEPIPDADPKIIPKTVLTRNGYRLNKTLEDAETLEHYRRDLTVKPFLMDDQDVEPYPIHRETPSELIIPRYYGAFRYGAPDRNDLREVPADLEFKGQLRDFQVAIVDNALRHLREKGGGIISVGCGRGKCFAKGTPIMMSDGTTKRVEDVKVGDSLMGDDSRPRRVLSLATGVEEMFDIVDPKGSAHYTVNRSHILSLKYRSTTKRVIHGVTYGWDDVLDISVDDYLKLPPLYHGARSPLRGYRVPVSFPGQDVPEDPYGVGSRLWQGIRVGEPAPVFPTLYRHNSEEVRLQVVAGLIGESIRFETSENRYRVLYYRDYRWLDDLIFLVRSLGFSAETDNDRDVGVWVTIDGDNLDRIPLRKRAPTPLDPAHQRSKAPVPGSHLVYRVGATAVGLGQYYGFEIDGNRRFLLGDFTVAHNTVMALKIACELKLKTLVVVHKTFLQDQWIERASQFTNARLGVIRQNKIQIKDKDIVIGMIQSISMKEYDPSVFNEFSLVIQDECHHVPARIFSNALYKTGARYTLGLSATPYRPDGLTKVIHWYLGDFIHREETRKNRQVVAKIFHFKTNDPLFREKKKWIKGAIRPDVMKMTANLCELPVRNTHIVTIINQLRKFPERKILILGTRKPHLVGLKTAVDASIQEDIASGAILADECKTYMYTGDSSKVERKDAETNGDILFATFQLANEGLDIERLNTIILVTPMKNIIQAVGRIMRKILKEGDIRPLIIDLTDELSVFRFQAEARLRQYQKSKYKTEHYYLKNDKLITFDTYMQQEQNMTQEEIEQMDDRVVYEPTFSSILDMQRVTECGTDEEVRVDDYELPADGVEGDDDAGDGATDANDEDAKKMIRLPTTGKKNSTYLF